MTVVFNKLLILATLLWSIVGLFLIKKPLHQVSNGLPSICFAPDCRGYLDTTKTLHYGVNHIPGIVIAGICAAIALIIVSLFWRHIILYFMFLIVVLFLAWASFIELAMGDFLLVVSDHTRWHEAFDFWALSVLLLALLWLLLVVLEYRDNRKRKQLRLSKSA